MYMRAQVRVIDSDLGGSTGLMKVKEKHPEVGRPHAQHTHACMLACTHACMHIYPDTGQVYIQSGVMERGNFSACAGFGMEEGKQACRPMPAYMSHA